MGKPGRAVGHWTSLLSEEMAQYAIATARIISGSHLCHCESYQSALLEISRNIIAHTFRLIPVQACFSFPRWLKSRQSAQGFQRMSLCVLWGWIIITRTMKAIIEP